ncbi:MAG: hypothetical protein ACOC7R_00275 [Planctomycetota bacterium]
MTDPCTTPLPDCIEKLAMLTAARKEDSQKLDRILRHLEGNGRDGLLVRVDRLEQAEQRRSWLVRVIAAVVIGLIAKMTFWK